MLRTLLPPPKEMEKKETGTIKVCSASNVCVVQLVDNKAVILTSNHQMHESLNKCIRYNRTKKARLDVNQQYLIRKYNAHTIGVDQLDSFMNNQPPCIGGKNDIGHNLLTLYVCFKLLLFDYFII